MIETNRDLSYCDCRLCPRECGVDRTRGIKGFCAAGSSLRIAWAGLHRGEEPPLIGFNGSGTVFFSGCTMQCRFCQNSQLSRRHMGSEVTANELGRICLDLEAAGAANINFVTGTHFVPGIIEALTWARARGLSLPVVWNSSGFERREVLEQLSPYIDLWLPDLKTLNPRVSGPLFHTEKYPGVVEKAVSWMAASPVRGIPWAHDGVTDTLRVILRHLVLPGHIDDTREVLSWWSCNRVPGMVLSLMTQYIPTPRTKPIVPDRPLNTEELDRLSGLIDQFAITEGFIQEPEDTDLALWLPDFSRDLPFPPRFARSLWSWRTADTKDG